MLNKQTAENIFAFITGDLVATILVAKTSLATETFHVIGLVMYWAGGGFIGGFFGLAGKFVFEWAHKKLKTYVETRKQQ